MEQQRCLLAINPEEKQTGHSGRGPLHAHLRGGHRQQAALVRPGRQAVTGLARIPLRHDPCLPLHERRLDRGESGGVVRVAFLDLHRPACQPHPKQPIYAITIAWYPCAVSSAHEFLYSGTWHHSLLTRGVAGGDG